MIYTVTLNPAIDKTIVIDEYRRNEVNRSMVSRKDVGGKGINVSKVLKVLGVDSVCTGILGEENSNFFLDYLKSLKIENDFFKIPGENRTNIKIVEKNYETITDINDRGFVIKKNEIDNFLDYFMKLVKEEDLVVLSGSLPEGLETDIYEEIIHRLKEKSVKVILDADGSPMINGIKAVPYAIKPNIHELQNVVDVDEKDINSVLKGGKKLIEKGIEKVLISLGVEGAVYITRNNSYYSKGMEVMVKSTVGAGDAMVAGLIYAMENNLSDFETLKLAIACATAKVMTEGTKIPDNETIKNISKDIIVKSL